MEKKITYHVEDLPKIVNELKRLMEKKRIFALAGSLGAGKTTLVRSLLQSLGVTGVISSPTFTYVNIYTTKKGQKIYHFDLYRIKNMQEFNDAGFDEYLNDQDAFIFIEWPEVILTLLKKDSCFLMLDYIDEYTRSIEYS